MADVGPDPAHRPLVDIHYADLGGQELAPGTYTAAAALGLTGKLKLVGVNDGPSVSGDEWNFLIGGAFTTTASSEMVIYGDGTSANVHWVATGEILLGANSVAVGSMETPGALTVESGTPDTPSFTFDDLGLAGTWTFTIGGALTLAADSYMVLTSGTVNWVVSGAIIIGTGSTAVGSMKSEFGAILVGAAATCKDLDAAGAITVGAAAVTGDVTAGGALTVGAGAETGILYPSGACTGSNCPLP
jgi:hypothetical protein